MNRAVGWGWLVFLAVTVGVGMGALSHHTSPWASVVLPVVLGAGLLAYRSPLRATATALLLVPVGLVHLVGPLKVAQLLSVLTVGTLAVSRLSRGRTPLPIPRQLLPAVALLAVSLISTGSALDSGLAVKQDLALALGLGLCAAIVAVSSDLRSWLVLVRAALVGATLITLPALVSSRDVQAQYGGSVVKNRPVGIFAQPNELGAFAMLVALVALGTLLGATRRADRWLSGVALASSTAAMLVSLSRGAWIGSVVGVLCLIVWVPRARRLVAGSAAAVVLAATFLGAFAPDLPQVQVVTARISSLGSSQQNPYDDRPAIWREAFREIADRPVLGQGPGAFPIASTRSVSAARTVEAEHAHNVLLTTAAEVGLLGLAALLALTLTCAGAVRRGIAAARRVENRLLLGALAGCGSALAALMGEGLVDVTLRNVVVAQTVWAVLGLALAGARLAVELPGQAAATDFSASVGVPSGLTRP